MKFLMLTALTLVFLGLLIGCSDKKDDAAQLEQEMMDMDTPEEETSESMGDTGWIEDTGADVVDAGAIPEETVDEPEIEVTDLEGEGYTVQVAACESPEYARHLVDKYFGRGYEAYITRTVVDGQTFYRVRIGNFTTQSEAKELQAELMDKYTLTVWVTPTGE